MFSSLSVIEKKTNKQDCSQALWVKTCNKKMFQPVKQRVICACFWNISTPPPKKKKLACHAKDVLQLHFNKDSKLYVTQRLD